jgi:hypothetical protein
MSVLEIPPSRGRHEGDDQTGSGVGPVAQPPKALGQGVTHCPAARDSRARRAATGRALSSTSGKRASKGERFISDYLNPIIEPMAAAAAQDPDSNFAPPSREAWYELHDSMTA